MNKFTLLKDQGPDCSQSLQRIKEKDPKFHASICELVDYLATTYDDKYANSELPNEGIIYSKLNGKGFNMGNAAKYISRYLTTGFQKSEMTADLRKAIHYCLFELTRKNNLK